MTTYRCPLCQHTQRSGFFKPETLPCPRSSCSGTMRKINASPGIAFKGEGFYKND